MFLYIKWEFQIFCSFAYTPPAPRRPDPTCGDKREEDDDDNDDDDDDNNDDTTSTNNQVIYCLLRVEEICSY